MLTDKEAALAPGAKEIGEGRTIIRGTMTHDLGPIEADRRTGSTRIADGRFGQC
jgi:hypothetical protein